MKKAAAGGGGGGGCAGEGNIIGGWLDGCVYRVDEL